MKATVFINGGYLRALARQAGYSYGPDYIEAVALVCVSTDETLLRVLYYDCAPFSGDPPLPVSDKPAGFRGSDEWLNVLAAKPRFAVRRGTLKFRGFTPKRTPINPNALSDADFTPQFEQTGVDMRLGLDIAKRLLGAATLDRLPHGAYRLTLEGESYRSPRPMPERRNKAIATGGKTKR